MNTQTIANNLDNMAEAIWTMLCADERFVAKLALCKTNITTIEALANFIRDYVCNEVNQSYPCGAITFILAFHALKVADWQQIAEKHWYDVQIGSFTRYARTITQRVR